MKSLKSKVILSAVVLIFALVATIGSTFAWFTVSNTVATSNIQLNVISADSLLIKLANYTATDGQATDAAQTNPANYSQYVDFTNANLAAAGYFSGTDDSYSDWKVQLLSAIQPGYATVSPNPALLRTMDPLVASNPTRDLVLNTVFNSSTPGAIQFKFWVMSQSEASKVLRLSVLNLTATNPSSQVNEALLASLRASVYSTAVSNGYIYMAGLPATPAAASYDYAFTFTNANLSTYWSGSFYNPLLQGFNKIDDLTLGIDGSSDPLNDEALAALHYGTASSNIITLTQNIPQLITLTIWIEGWDAQATNLINTAFFNADFKFIIA